MAQIGFTHKTEHVYDRFEKMRRAYEDANGRTYAPGFLTALIDAFEVINQLNAVREEWIKAHPKSTASFVIEPGDTAGFQLWRIEEGDYADQIWHDITGNLEPISLRAHIAESNEQVVIKDGSCRYMTESTMAGANFFLTDYKDKAMVFNNRDQAAAFLRKCGHEVGNWIIEPA